MEQLSKIRFALILLIAIMVAGCTASLEGEQVGCHPETPEFTVICDNVRGYTYKQPSWIRDLSLNERGISVSTYDYPLTKEEKEQLKGYYGEIPSSISCAPGAIGINFPENIPVENADNTIWGRMDEREISRGDFTPEYTDICGPYSGESMYAFCSEKGDKRVVICINQQTDNKELAEEVFKSFRWTE